MKKNIIKLFAIISIFATTSIFNNRYMGQELTNGYIYYITLGVILSLLIGIVVNEKDIRSSKAVSIYGASTTLAGIVVGVLYGYNIISFMGQVENDLYIFEEVFIKGIFLAVSFGIIGLVIVILSLKKASISPLILLMCSAVVSIMLIYNIYTSCIANEFTQDIVIMHRNLVNVRNVAIATGFIHWGFIVYIAKNQS